MRDFREGQAFVVDLLESERTSVPFFGRPNGNRIRRPPINIRFEENAGAGMVVGEFIHSLCVKYVLFCMRSLPENKSLGLFILVSCPWYFAESVAIHLVT